MKRIFRALFAAVLGVVLITSPVYAISNPTSISLVSQRVFEDVFEANDMLFIIYYDVAYAAEPSDDPSVAFLFNIYDTNGTTLLFSRGVNYYQENLISIYLTAAQSAALTWGNAYYVRITGNPAMFTTMTEGVNMVTHALAPTEWITGSLTTTPDFLYAYLYAVMEAMNTALAPPAILVSSSEGDVLNSLGRTYFTEAIPGLDTVVPTLFQVAVTNLDVVAVVSDGTLATELSITNKLGAQFAATFAMLGTWWGISTAMAAGLFLSGMCLFVMYLVYLYSASTTAAMVLAVPFLLIGAWSGLLPLGIMYTITILIAAYMGYHLWLRGV